MEIFGIFGIIKYLLFYLHLFAVNNSLISVTQFVDELINIEGMNA